MNIIERRVVLYAALLFLYLPAVVLVIYSFNDSRLMLSWQGFTWRWYVELFRSPEIALGLKNTVIVSFTATVVSVILGTLLAVGLHFQRFPGRRFIDVLFYLPIIIPDIIMAISLLAFYVFIHLTPGHLSIILAHIAFQISFVAFVVKSRMQDFPAHVIEAARDLGATPFQALYKIVLPIIKPGIAAGALIAFALSVDDFLITYFTAGVGASTLPVRIYSMVKRGVTPDINALSTLLLAATLIFLYLGLKLLHKPER